MSWENIFTCGAMTLIFEAIKYFVDRKDKKDEKKDNTNDKLENISTELKEVNTKVTEQGVQLSELQVQTKEQDKQLDKIEKDSVRSQLMMMIKDYPNREEEILEIAEHYFNGLDGNWYATKIFKNWMLNNNVDKPSWFNK